MVVIVTRGPIQIATFMRMKDEQTKPAYNVQVGSERQIIVGVSVHQEPTDTACAINHCEQVHASLGKLPSTIVADAGYGSEENYTYFDSVGSQAFIKHNEFYRWTHKPVWRCDPFRSANWDYDTDRDTYTCPGGQDLVFTKDEKRFSRRGFESHIRVYTCSNCDGCSLKEQCLKNTSEDTCRSIHVHERLNALKEQANTL